MDSLISAAALAALIDRGAVLVLDASMHLPAADRDPAAEFAASHIPGARFLALASLTDAASPVPAALPTGAQVAERLAALGWQPGQAVVLYDDSDIRTSARAWFALTRAGVSPVAILDGGLAAWKAAGLPLERGAADTSTASVAELTADTARVRSKADVLAASASGAEQIVDARDAGRFTGETVDTVHNLPGGHIPGARNLFFKDLFAADGTYLPPAELRAAFAEAGVDLDRPIIASCGSGVTASVLLFALHLIGVDDAALYDGSWSEWGTDPATPKELGAAR